VAARHDFALIGIADLAICPTGGQFILSLWQLTGYTTGAVPIPSVECKLDGYALMADGSAKTLLNPASVVVSGGLLKEMTLT
jgi:hypothetical protein